MTPTPNTAKPQPHMAEAEARNLERVRKLFGGAADPTCKGCGSPKSKGCDADCEYAHLHDWRYQ